MLSLEWVKCSAMTLPWNELSAYFSLDGDG